MDETERDQRIEAYYQESARYLAERVVLLEDIHQETMKIVSDWCIEVHEVDGVDAGDLVWRLEQAGFQLPDIED